MSAWPPSRQALAILNHPDRRTDWVVLYGARLERPVTAAELDAGLDRIRSALPIVGARLRGALWESGEPAPVRRCDDDPVGDPRLAAPFALEREPPLRLVLGDDGLSLGLAFHHAALDGRALMGILGALLGKPLPPPADPPPAGPASGPGAALRRLVAPADPVAPSTRPPRGGALAARTVEIDGRGITGRVAAAAVAAAGARNSVLDAPWRRIGLSLAVGGPAGAANAASYRRIDISPADDVERAVAAALATPSEPGELVRSSPALRLLAPLAERLTDSLLISNLGRHEIPGLSSFEVYPVARGRSGVAFGAGAVAGGGSTLALRAARLTQADAESLLDATVERLSSARELAVAAVRG